jgi:ABC-2 type transport system ATP-binding protein
MVMNAGRVVATDTPSGLIEMTGSEQRLRFRPSVPIADEDLAALPEVVSVVHEGAQTIVTGTGNVVHAVTALLAQRRVIAEELRIDQNDLEDAYLALTNHDDTSAGNEEEGN